MTTVVAMKCARKYVRVTKPHGHSITTGVVYELNIQDILVFILIVDTNLEHEQLEMGKHIGSYKLTLSHPDVL
jgi:hypothetical protein